MTDTYECPECFRVYYSPTAADRCAMWCGDTAPDHEKYRPRRFDDYDE